MKWSLSVVMSTRMVLVVVVVGLLWSSTANAFVVVPRHSDSSCGRGGGNVNVVGRCSTRKATATTNEGDATTIAVNPRLEGLAFQLDDGTRKSHSMAQNSAFVTGFFKGLSTKDSYRTLLTSLYFVYEAMEEAFESTQCEKVQTLDDPELRRLEALTVDMEYFYGPKWKEQLPKEQSAATQTYVARVQEVAQGKQPYLLLAHQYTRYLGDLFGGQMMGGMATRSLDLEEGQGTAFYQFQDIPNTYEYITDWYSRLNALDLTEAQKQEIVDEANFVFDLNIGILQELEGSPLLALWTLTVNTLKLRLGLTK